MVQAVVLLPGDPLYNSYYLFRISERGDVRVSQVPIMPLTTKTEHNSVSNMSPLNDVDPEVNSGA